ncbi:glycoside hydrolase family 3 protein [Thalassotalea aquiviva]|uniref:glycoside hydrolase family 3 protein n=1 Tax=Thalassotalea aquiviva TaxID=3242415 RepID=UPI00352BC133
MKILNRLSLRDKIAQKLIIDLRYYNQDSANENDQRPLTVLPAELAKLISNSNLGGVILFSENLDNSDQIIQLTHDLQHAASASSSGLPLFISIDQEGGRVFRTKRSQTTGFSGNMAIGATYKQHGHYYAKKTAEVIAKELKVLGINVNHAPTIDINSNPKNPVINVRSFGEDANMVAELGCAQVKAFEQQGIIATLKHFPGHGDTDTDSHTGLPRVERSSKAVHKVEISPYKQIFATKPPGMVMSAHIQYPSLDSSTLLTKNGKQIIKPATMSRAIMSDLLREQLNYQGVVVTDAMDMAGISDFFTPLDAIIHTFAAGVDIAVMALKIRCKSDIAKFEQSLDFLTKAVRDGKLKLADIDNSLMRIIKLKQDFELTQAYDVSVAKQQQKAKQILANPLHRELERQLSIDAVTQVTGHAKDVIINTSDKVHLIMPDEPKCLALKAALTLALPNLQVTYTNALKFDSKTTDSQISQADVVIGAHIWPKQSAAEIGGMDDLVANITKSEQVVDADKIFKLLKKAKQIRKRVIFVSLRTPYEISRFVQVADATLVTYSYTTYTETVEGNADKAKINKTIIRSPALAGLAQVLAGKALAKGHLPVTVAGI